MCFRNLERLLNNERLEAFAREALSIRNRKRSEAEVLVRSGAFKKAGAVSYAILDERIDSEFFPSRMPEAVIVLTFNPLPSDPARWQVKIRLGLGAPAGLSLSDLQIDDLDPAYGGRWNAGSNRRGGGTAMRPEEYAHKLADRGMAALESIRSGKTVDRLVEEH